MRLLGLAILLAAGAARAGAGGQGDVTSESAAAKAARAGELIRELRLTVLPKESGYLGIVGVSRQRVMVGGRALAVQSQNYYLLTRELPVNYLHWLEPDDTHILIEGGPVDYFIFCPAFGTREKRAEKVTLGMDLAKGERPIVAVPGGCWKALKLHDGAGYALMSNTLSPEFTPDRVRIGAGTDWVKEWAGSAGWATPEFLRELIGPNWR